MVSAAVKKLLVFCWRKKVTRGNELELGLLHDFGGTHHRPRALAGNAGQF